MLLSIVMMVKNEENNLDRTLSALNKLIENINSEIIILDTGSTDNTVNIAKKYTDKVYFEKWNNNFADMRNKSLSYAKGDWVLVLDADEVLVECDKLIEFFNTDLYKKYNSASIKLMNIMNEDESAYDFASILRLFKYEKGFCYKGSIHEQPKCKGPMYKDIAFFKHYGYKFSDKDLLNKKYNRNEKILLEEIEKNPNDPYMNYQLAKNYCILNSKEDAIFYMEKSLNLYKKIKYIPTFVISNLAQLYMVTNEYRKCEALCLDYIKKDNKNIDIYFYLGISQSNLDKRLDSIKSLERYIYLTENYEISTQANSIEAESLTLNNKENAKWIILSNYYEIKKYEDVVNCSKSYSYESLSKIYYKLIYSLYKLERYEHIIEIYNYLKDDIEKNKFVDIIEILINNIKKSDKEIIFSYLSKINDNYGYLNSIRAGNEVNLDKCKEILKSENNYYFGELIYYLIKNNIDFNEIILDISLYKLELYITYLIKNKEDIKDILYDYITNKGNSLEFNNLKIDSTICKLLCKYSDVSDIKYKEIFLTYILYRVNYLKLIYNQEKIKCNLSDVIINKDDKFVLDLYDILNLKTIDKLSFIRKIRDLLKEYPEYKKGIQCLLDDIEKEINSNEEIEVLKKEYKSLIEKIIASNDLSKALDVVSQYEEMFGNEEMYNIRAIINLYLGNIEESEKLLKLSYINDPFNEDTIFNIAYIKEIKQDYQDAISFYEKLLSICEDENLKDEVMSKLDTLISQK